MYVDNYEANNATLTTIYPEQANALTYSNPFERQPSGQSATFKFKNTLLPD
jgi:hypothetical protein